jgi:uncharacterized membrane protein
MPDVDSVASCFKRTVPAGPRVTRMIPNVVLFSVFCGLLGLRALGVRALRGRSWVVFLRWALGCMFLVTASAHWGPLRADLVRMVPASFPNPELLVTLSGVAEIAGAIGLFVPRIAPFAAAGLALLLIAVFPANVHAARAGLTLGGTPVTTLSLRALEQLVFLVAVLVAGFWPIRPRRIDAAASS